MNISTHILKLIKDMPKLDLHCHLDGSFSPEFVRDTIMPDADSDKLLTQLRAPENCSGLAEYLTCFDLPIKCLQTPKDIEAGVLDVLRQAAAENVKYIELRFAPACSVNSEQNYRDVYEAAISGCKRGLEAYNIHSNIIICAMRHHDIKTNIEVLHTGMEYVGDGICAMDLAGDEAAFGNSQFTELFTELRRYGMPFTIHSGECGSSENIKIALEAGASRVGHGIALYKDPVLMSICKKAGMGLELCPTSNYQTRAVKPEDIYPLRKYLDFGILATVNTDNRTVSNTSMTHELELAIDKLDIREEDLVTLYKNSVEISFADNNIKNMLISQIDL